MACKSCSFDEVRDDLFFLHPRALAVAQSNQNCNEYLLTAQAALRGGDVVNWVENLITEVSKCSAVLWASENSKQ